ncbi:MAG: DUF503 domain-containing protein [candidate division WOR-3 bacterium]|nr:DUF503 domain-containing protein [candidate division WOR-3 bacterium]MCX7947025.1 DUF503 domain-containing protein [candidate division WOR-3 bacterium]MDW8149934.1 DUF503 domain-containing protein [candidate division WOR-3 bacterium]
MIVGVLEVEVFIPYSRSIKEKRHIVKSIKDKVKSKFNVSVAELDYYDAWQRSKLGFACLNSNVNYINSQLLEILKFLEEDRRFEITQHRISWF